MVNTVQWSAVFLAAITLCACGGQSDTSSAKQDASPSPEVQATPAAQPERSTSTASASSPAEAAPARAPSPEFANLPAPYSSADYARAKRIWRQCSSCHTLSPDADHLVGPNLYAMFERNVGAAEGFNYSNALQEADFRWTPEQLDQWLTSPRNFLPGNRMSFSGVRNADDRANVIAYILAASEPSETE